MSEAAVQAPGVEGVGSEALLAVRSALRLGGGAADHLGLGLGHPRPAPSAVGPEHLGSLTYLLVVAAWGALPLVRFARAARRESHVQA